MELKSMPDGQEVVEIQSDGDGGNGRGKSVGDVQRMRKEDSIDHGQLARIRSGEIADSETDSQPVGEVVDQLLAEAPAQGEVLEFAAHRGPGRFTIEVVHALDDPVITSAHHMLGAPRKKDGSKKKRATRLRALRALKSNLPDEPARKTVRC